MADVKNTDELALYLADVVARNKIRTTYHAWEKPHNYREEGYTTEDIGVKIQHTHYIAVNKDIFELIYKDRSFEISGETFEKCKPKLESVRLRTDEIIFNELETLLDKIDHNRYWMVTTSCYRDTLLGGPLLVNQTYVTDKEPLEFISELNKGKNEFYQSSIVFSQTIDEQTYNMHKDVFGLKT